MAYIPVITPREVVDVTSIDPFPVVEPIVLPLVVPIFTLPPRIEIPEKIPGKVVVPLVVDSEIPAMILPCRFETVAVPTVSSMARYRFANAPS